MPKSAHTTMEPKLNAAHRRVCPLEPEDSLFEALMTWPPPRQIREIRQCRSDEFIVIF